MYQVVTRTCAAPKSGGGKYRRPVRILVVDATNGIKAAYRSGDPTIKAEWHNVDSRYDGPRSAYGRALQAAIEMVNSLNFDQEPTSPINVRFDAEGGFRIEN